VEIARDPGALRLAYRITADLERLAVPPPRVPRIADRLWQHTCCEIFVTRQGLAGYHEFNLSPSGEWAVRAFSGYRDGVLLEDERLNPRIAVRRGRDLLQLDARIALEQLPYTGSLLLGLSAVTEESGGRVSYWALAHPPGKPDFHHACAFALQIDEAGR
jgi:hypothetical protein